jgi:lipid-A-disaccharide synthase
LPHSRILISAGEASGEMYGAQLMEALRRRQPGLEFFGVGGEKMRAAGCDTVVDARDLAVVGITEILSHLPKIYCLFKRLIAAADAEPPALAVVIDSPAFNWRVARQMRKRGIPVVYYVCPQFWAWRQGRVRLLRKYVNHALVIFPFEENFFRERGVETTFVGHPLADIPPPTVTREDFAARYGLDPAKYWITLMPGSRRKEVLMNLPEMLRAADGLVAAHELILPVAPTLDRAFLAAQLGAARNICFVPESRPALFHSRAAIVASGTATVEAALMNTPFAMVYRVSGLTYALGRWRIKVPHFCMVNLIAGERIVSELVQHDFTAAKIQRELESLLADGAARATMLEGFVRVRARLHNPALAATSTAADRAAELILRLLPAADT